MSLPIEYTSFLIRLWRETNPEAQTPPADWRGEVEHIQSGQRWTFNTLDELMDFLRQHAEGPEMPTCRENEGG
jgi:hypothetical protein